MSVLSWGTFVMEIHNCLISISAVGTLEFNAVSALSKFYIISLEEREIIPWLLNGCLWESN